MKCRGLFLANDVVYIPVTIESVTDMMKDVKSFAFYNNMKIKTELGFFVRQETLTVEKAVRCEVLERPEEQKQIKLTSEERAKKAVEVKKRKEEKLERNKQILEDLKNGLSARSIAEKNNVSRQLVYRLKEEQNQ